MLVSLMCITVMGQGTIPEPGNRGYRKWKRAQAFSQVHQLRDGGVLLVRLNTYAQAIAALEKAQQPNWVAKAKRIITQENQDIRAAFAEDFSFCSVYFFSSEQSQWVLSGALDSVKFTNAQGDVVPQDSISDRYWLLGDFAHSDPYQNSGMAVNGLVIYSQNYKQLLHPFPYFNRKIFSRPDLCVPKLQFRLEELEKRAARYALRFARKRKSASTYE